MLYNYQLGQQQYFRWHHCLATQNTLKLVQQAELATTFTFKVTQSYLTVQWQYCRGFGGGRAGNIKHMPEFMAPYACWTTCYRVQCTMYLVWGLVYRSIHSMFLESAHVHSV
jgi:hypothetical protein